MPGASGVSGYERLQATTAPFDAPVLGQLSSIQIACSTGKVPIAGGYELVNIAAQKLSVISSFPVKDSTVTGWRLLVKNVIKTGPISSAQCRIHVVCALML